MRSLAHSNDRHTLSSGHWQARRAASAQVGPAQPGSARLGSTGSHSALTPPARALCHRRLGFSPRHDGAACSLARHPQLSTPLQRCLRDRPTRTHTRARHNTPRRRQGTGRLDRADPIRSGRDGLIQAQPAPPRCSHAHLRASTHSHYRLRMPLDAVDTGRDCWPELSNPAGP